jgi:GDPmannose 4,6-dehydratase
MKSENILITGITGQDGIFLTSSLIEMNKKANIFGISRDGSSTFIKNINKFNQNLTTENIHVINIDLQDKKQVFNLIEDIEPSQIYNLTGPSSVYESINKADFYRKSIPNMFNNLTESCIELRVFPSFFQASSSETFDKNNSLPLNENSSFNPRTPYAEAKYEVYNSVRALREAYDWNIKAGIMFNHESEYREQGYLFSKIIDSAIKIKNNQLDKLVVGSLSYIRDWSFAGDVAEAILSINFSKNSDDFVIGSGLGTSIEDLLNITFSEFSLDYNKYVEVDSSLLRIGDPQKIVADPTRLKNKIGWHPKLNIQQLIKRCISFKLNKP